MMTAKLLQTRLEKPVFKMLNAWVGQRILTKMLLHLRIETENALRLPFWMLQDDVEETLDLKLPIWKHMGRELGRSIDRAWLAVARLIS